MSSLVLRTASLYALCSAAGHVFLSQGNRRTVALSVEANIEDVTFLFFMERSTAESSGSFFLTLPNMVSFLFRRSSPKANEAKKLSYAMLHSWTVRHMLPIFLYCILPICSVCIVWRDGARRNLTDRKPFLIRHFNKEKAHSSKRNDLEVCCASVAPPFNYHCPRRNQMSPPPTRGKYRGGSRTSTGAVR